MVAKFDYDSSRVWLYRHRAGSGVPAAAHADHQFECQSDHSECAGFDGADLVDEQCGQLQCLARAVVERVESDEW